MQCSVVLLLCRLVVVANARRREILQILLAEHNDDFLFNSLCRGRIQREMWGIGPYAGADYNLTLSLSRLRNPEPEFIVLYWS